MISFFNGLLAGASPSRLRRVLMGMIGIDEPARALVARLVGEGPSRDTWRLVEKNGLSRLARLGSAELGALGLSTRAAGRLAAAFALGRAVERAREEPHADQPIAGASDVARVVAPELRGVAVEVFLVLLLDARSRLLELVEVARGTATSAPVHPREVLGPAIRRGAVAVIVAHNHPSGDPTPSEADHAVTQRLVQAGELLGVPVLDHLVWGDRGWVSLRAHGRWPS